MCPKSCNTKYFDVSFYYVMLIGYKILFLKAEGLKTQTERQIFPPHCTRFLTPKCRLGYGYEATFGLSHTDDRSAHLIGCLYLAISIYTPTDHR
jgi:hypothetical protein